MAGIFPDFFGGNGGGGVLGPLTDHQNAVLGYLSGALQGGNLGQSIARGLEGWMRGAQLDQSGHAQRAASQYVADAPDLDPALRHVLTQNPALAMRYLAGRIRPAGSRDITEYEYARRQGFGGSLADWVGRKGQAPAGWPPVPHLWPQ